MIVIMLFFKKNISPNSNQTVGPIVRRNKILVVIRFIISGADGTTSILQPMVCKPSGIGNPSLRRGCLN